MSRPGHWRMSDGTEIPYAEMTEAHLRNSMRLLARRYFDCQQAASTVSTPLTELQRRRQDWLMNKLIELADEAYRRGGIMPPGDLHEWELLNVVSSWPATRDEGTASRLQANASARAVTARPYVASPFEHAATVANLPPKWIGRYLNVIHEVELILALPVYGLGSEDSQRPDRRIELDL